MAVLLLLPASAFTSALCWRLEVRVAGRFVYLPMDEFCRCCSEDGKFAVDEEHAC